MSSHLSVLLRGVVIGFSIAMPVGPIGVLCIRRTLAQGRAFGLVSGLGAATADAVYGFIAAFGLTLISDILIERQTWFRLIGGVFLCYLGIKTFLIRPAQNSASIKRIGLVQSYTSTLLLTLTNPVTILSFAAIFAGAGIATIGEERGQAALLVAGTFAGSSLWWFVLSGGTSLLSRRLSTSQTPSALHWINRVSGMIVTGFGVAALVSIL
jgi:threonine/homoserine/homoserine lactone efflux protein